ncbi:hypothetical protein NLU66_04735 [Brachybacterium sp. NBEC-018]|uniref:hypothetical protein n=1 Tax=Brachybacterium sp. NBEC-018 TaxID=2996004 RepID=UPI0021751C48|nr:hypothetical protein [Brachybacterium sp. NBEC-018]UVY84909.1 hypothetical protein NLU66_04735 [Brachybacterium sp. NBEC-018]
MTAARAERPTGILRFFVVPGAVIAANTATLLGVASVVLAVPVLAGCSRALGDLDAHGDEAFRSVLRHARRTWRRDLPVTVLLWLVLAAVAGNVLALPALAPGVRTFTVGMLVPLGWVVIAWLSAYVVLAARTGAERGDLVLGATSRLLRSPGRALLAPLAVIALSPLWLLAPLTIAGGLAVPPFLLRGLWGAGPGDDAGSDGGPADARPADGAVAASDAAPSDRA